MKFDSGSEVKSATDQMAELKFFLKVGSPDTSTQKQHPNVVGVLRVGFEMRQQEEWDEVDPLWEIWYIFKYSTTLKIGKKIIFHFI